MARAAEDRAGAVFHEHEVGDVDRQRGVVLERVADREAGIMAALLGALDGLLAGAHAVALGDERGQRRIARGELIGQRVVRRNRAERRAEDGVVARREDLEPVVAADHLEEHAQAFRAADPAFLHKPYAIGPARQAVERFQELVGEFGDAQHPLGAFALFDDRARAPAAAVDDLLVGQHGPIDRVPIDP